MTQRVVVVGATGHIGRPLCGELLGTGDLVTVFSRDPAHARLVVPGAGAYVGTSAGGSAPAVPGPHGSISRDEVGIVIFALREPMVRGPVNLTSPEPARAREFARTRGAAVNHRAWLAVPSPLARMGLGVVTDILVRGKQVIPAQACARGYQFRFPVLDAALRDLLSDLGEAAGTAR